MRLVLANLLANLLGSGLLGSGLLGGLALGVRRDRLDRGWFVGAGIVLHRVEPLGGFVCRAGGLLRSGLLGKRLLGRAPRQPAPRQPGASAYAANGAPPGSSPASPAPASSSMCSASDRGCLAASRSDSASVISPSGTTNGAAALKAAEDPSSLGSACTASSVSTTSSTRPAGTSWTSAKGSVSTPPALWSYGGSSTRETRTRPASMT